MNNVRRALALVAVAALLLSALAAGALARPGTALAYRGETLQTVYYNPVYPNSGCGYDFYVAYGYTVYAGCVYTDGWGNATFDVAWLPTCQQGGGCRFSGYVPAKGWGWRASRLSMVADDDYGGWHGYIVNAWT